MTDFGRTTPEILTSHTALGESIPINTGPPEIPDTTPLHLAVRNYNLAEATKLLEQGADPNVQDKLGMTPLHWTAMKGQSDLAQLLLFYEADIHIRDHFSGGVTPVGMAQLLGYEELATMMDEWPS